MSAEVATIVEGLGALEEVRWSRLQEGVIEFQRCRRCGNAWLPARSECPSCLASDWEWEPASGDGTLVSWVVYHRAFHPAFKDDVPYAVALVELDEGPRMITRMQGVPEEVAAECGDPVRVAVVELGGVRVANAQLAKAK